MAVQNLNYFSIMFYYILSTPYQKNLETYFALLYFWTFAQCEKLCCVGCVVWNFIALNFLNLLRQQKSIEYWLSDVEAHWRLKARLRCDSAFHYCIVLNCTAQWENGCPLFGKKVFKYLIAPCYFYYRKGSTKHIFYVKTCKKVIFIVFDMPMCPVTKQC